MAALLEIRDLQTSFFTSDGEVRAVNGVTFSIEAGKTMGLVGESGCGKSVTALSVIQLLTKGTGRIVVGVGNDTADAADQERPTRYCIIEPEPPARRRDITIYAFLDIAFQVTSGWRFGISVAVISAMRMPRRQDFKPGRRLPGVATIGITRLRQNVGEVSLAIHTEQPAILDTFSDRARLQPVEIRGRENVEFPGQVAAVLRCAW